MTLLFPTVAISNKCGTGCKYTRKVCAMNQSAYFLARIENSERLFSPAQHPPENRKSEISRGVCATGYPPSYLHRLGGGCLCLSLGKYRRQAWWNAGNKDRTLHRAEIPTRNNIFLWEKKIRRGRRNRRGLLIREKPARLTRAISCWSYKSLVRIIWEYHWTLPAGR